MAFPASSVVLDSSLSDMVEVFSSHQDLSKLNYTAMVAIVLKHVRSSGLLLDVMEPIAFHPIPHFLFGKTGLRTSGVGRRGAK